MIVFSLSRREREILPVKVFLLNWIMQSFDVSKFKKRCLSLLENLDHEGVVITKHGKPVARLIPASSDCADLIGSMKGQIKIRGNIFSTGVRWRSNV